MSAVKRVKREAGGNPARCRHCVRELRPIDHWETGKRAAAMNEARRPALMWNVRSAVYGSVFSQLYRIPAARRICHVPAVRGSCCRQVLGQSRKEQLCPAYLLRVWDRVCGDRGRILLLQSDRKTLPSFMAGARLRLPLPCCRKAEKYPAF